MPAFTASRRIRALPAALAAALLVAACGGAASVAPSATPTPTTAPTATPFDVGAAFLAIISDEDFSARMDVDGTMEMGVTATITGTITGSGDDSRTLMTIAVGPTTIETESISTGGRSYSRSGDGPWLEDEPETGDDEDNLGAWLRGLEEIEDLGEVTKNGRTLHHLSAGDEPLPPGALGIDASTYKDPVVTMEFYAEADGTPAVFAVEGSWVQSIGGQDISVEFVMDLTLSNVGSPITIDAPQNVWQRYTSPLGYTMAHPEDFTVENREDYDAYLLGSDEWIYVTIWPEATGLNADGFLAEMLTLVQESWGDPVEAPTPMALAGEPGYLATFNFTYDDGSEGIAYDLLAMHDNVGWDITLYTLPGSEREDYALFEQFLSTFKYVD
ncbi:MAG TPA: hypothetical protein VFX65_07815 [Candidatus Limnocylindrales bacterium]|nr:hypothetical protein [Candidatus Limnocylindrales bacterium]